MRRMVVITTLLVALAAPAVALGVERAVGDGTLVVKNGEAPAATPVVALTITGSVIGHVDLFGKVVIDTGVNGPTPQVTGFDTHGQSTVSDTAEVWRGSGFSFRVVGGTNTVVLVYGSGVNLVAVGKGSVKLAGMPETPSGDGRYSLNGAEFVSLPGIQTGKLLIRSGS